MTQKNRTVSSETDLTTAEASPRSDGPLNQDDANILRTKGVPLSYDPVQIGWVPSHCDDDIHMMFKPTKGPRYAKLTQAQGMSYALRPWRASDLPVYHALLDDPSVWQHMIEDYPAPLSEGHAETLIELSNVSNHHEVRAVLQAGRPIGQVRLQFDHAADQNSAELSYWLGREHWGQGHGRAMVALFVKRSFADHPGMTALVARCAPQNTASHRILLSAGFLPDDAQDDPKWQWYRAERPN